MTKELLQKASRKDKHLHMTEVNYAEARYMSVAIEHFLAEHLGGRMQTSVHPDLQAHLDGLMVDPVKLLPEGSR